MIVYGKQIFFYILEKHRELINELYLAKECDKKSFLKIAKSGFKIKKLDFKMAQSLAKGGNHQGFLLDIKEFEFSDFSRVKKDKFIVILCGVTDVGNIGAITRTAYALGVDSLLFVGERLAIDGVIRTSSGAALDLPIVLVRNILDILNELKQQGFYLYASDSRGKNEFEIKAGKKALIMGSEGLGLPSRIVKKSDECIAVKMRRPFNSLNVGAAFSILCDRMANE